MKYLILIIILIFLVGCAQKEVEQMGKLKLSSVYSNNGVIPDKYGCKGENINPALDISGIPSGTKSLVLFFDDPDSINGWDHWIVFNIPVVSKIDEDSIPGIQGKNSWETNDYRGPCPPSGTHRYVFSLFALDVLLDLEEGDSRNEIEEAMKGHILAQTKLVGKYLR